MRTVLLVMLCVGWLGVLVCAIGVIRACRELRRTVERNERRRDELGRANPMYSR